MLKAPIPLSSCFASKNSVLAVKQNCQSCKMFTGVLIHLSKLRGYLQSGVHDPNKTNTPSRFTSVAEKSPLS